MTQIAALREAVRQVCARAPFHIDARVVLWRIPPFVAVLPAGCTRQGGCAAPASSRRR
ncbi:MAG TPA: hypothetical protein VH230_05470 [Stellaceae bacterium]|nr:hypothetical protein [Stellaceae bacterium]